MAYVGNNKFDAEFIVLFAVYLIFFCPTAQASTVKQVSCGQSLGSFRFMNNDIPCVNEEGSSYCDIMGFFDIDKSECFKCCSRSATPEPSPVSSVVTPLTAQKVSTTKKVTITEKAMTIGGERALTTKNVLNTEGVRKIKATSSEKFVLIGSLCALGVAIVFGVVILLRRHRRFRCGRRRTLLARPQPDLPNVDRRDMNYVGIQGDHRETIV